jgi:hypothetical protein
MEPNKSTKLNIHIMTQLLAQKPKLIGLGSLRYINYTFCLYFINVGHKPHKCMYNKIN